MHKFQNIHRTRRFKTAN